MNFSVISNDRGPTTRLLLLDSQRGWALPAHQSREPAEANTEIRNRFGLEVTTMDLHPVNETEPGTELQWLYVHELHGEPRTLPAGVQWVPITELSGSMGLHPGHCEVLRLWSANHGNGNCSGRLPWRCRGWFTAATAWATAELRKLGIKTTGPAEQLAFRARSCLLRLPTTHGWVYLKASSPAQAHEPALTRLLAQWFPGQVPAVLACDTAKAWMLTSDFGALRRPQGTEETVATFYSVAEHVARIQREAAGNAADIAATGCPDHRLDRLPMLFEELLSDEHVQSEELTSDESARLRQLIPMVARRCTHLASFGIPETLVHHDLWRGNFRATSSGTLLFDWADSVLGHPFFQLDILLRDLTTALNSEQATATVTDAYLSAWTERDSAASLREGAALAAAPSMVSRALLMRDSLTGLPLEARTAYHGAVAAPLRSLLALSERERPRARSPHRP